MKFTRSFAFLLGVFISPSFAHEKPNVILVMADDQGWGDTSYNGHPNLKTPNLDQLAKEGLQMNRFYAASAVCSPTRGSAIAGQNPIRLGIPYANTGHLKPDAPNLAKLLKQQGYRTGHFGKWHLGTLSKTIKDANRGGKDDKHYAPPWDLGFDTCFSTESKVPTWDPMALPAGQKDKRHWNALEEGAESSFYGTHYWVGEGKPVDPKTLSGCDSKLIMDQALSFIEKNADDQPIFMVIWFHAPHWPVVAGPEYAARYEGHSDFEKNYWGCISAIDDQMGRLKAKLKEKGMQNTLLCYASDNGPEGADPKTQGRRQGIGSAGHFTGRKRSLNEGGIRVPGIIHWPAKIASGRSSDSVACTTDYYPTICEVLSLPISEDSICDGTSLLPLIEEKTTTRNKPLGFAIQKQRAWMDGDYKLLSKNGKDFQLYNIKSDPAEKTDLATKQPEQFQKMLGDFKKWNRGLGK